MNSRNSFSRSTADSVLLGDEAGRREGRALAGAFCSLRLDIDRQEPPALIAATAHAKKLR